MKPTNYHLFDFLDFDVDLKKDESLWKAYKPLAVEEKDGDILVSVPFQKQVLDNDMAADKDVPQEVYTLVIRQYGPKITRLFMGFGEERMTDESEMLKYSSRIVKMPLHADFADDQWTISTGDSVKRAVINMREPVLDRWSDLQPDPQETLDIRLYPDGKREVRLAAYDHFSPPRYDALPLAFCKNEGRKERATLSFECKADECFAGTGERFAKMDLSGQTFLLKNQDGQGVNNRRTYKNIPFYVSSRMYGTFYHTCSHGKLSLAGHSTRSVQFLSDQAMVDAFVIGGDSFEEIIRGYRDLTGYPSMPPLWSFGVWMSRMTYFSADEVNGICDRLRSEHYPCDVIHLDTGWFKTDWLCEWKFNEERFPDPKAFVHGLKDKGFRVSLWQLPYVAENAEQIDEARANDYIGPLTKKQASEGSNFSALDYAGTIDFTYPEATAWYKGLLKRLLDMGVVCIKTDFGENIHMDAIYKGMKPELLNNLYALLYQKAAYEITKDVTGDGIVWARAAWAGCQRYPLHWGGDSCSSWDGMAGSLKGGLHFGLSGFAFWSHDVPGFHTLPNFMNSVVDDDVYIRWTQFGVFSSHIRYHGTNKREPWFYPNIAPLVKKWWKLRYALIPYILRESCKATESGSTLLQALVYHHPEDRTCWHIDDEYYFGDSFLVAPVMNSANRRDVYLPEGSWINFFTGEVVEGGRWLKDVAVPLEEMPVYVREGSVIPVYPEAVECTDDMDMSKEADIVIDKTFKGIFNTVSL
ncbi:alpha-xylosidase [Prevotella sp. PCHR]|uniref:Alpha-xylosidase n=5 Tax=Xylanibacter caecicola TaxID=2736294 RepID=A0ABX2AYD2_9BACT|nr:alpha-xylosidase [Xylanibacter caecicola]NPE23976.1 alpha-xylosidase [Xylanibacter caecicola]